MRLRWTDDDPIVHIMFIVLAVLPALYLPIRWRAPSDFLLTLIYFLTYIPTTATFPGITTLDLIDIIAYVAVFNASIIILMQAPRIRGMRMPRFSLSSRRFELLLYALSAAVVLVYAFQASIRITRFDLFDLYEERLAFQRDLAGRPALVTYVQATTANALAPIMMIFGLAHRRRAVVLTGAALLVYTFLVTTSKGYLFLVPGIALFWLAWKMWRGPAVLLVPAGAVGIGILSLLLDQVLFGGTRSIISWVFHFRLFGNSAFLSEAYYRFFSLNEKVLYTQSILNPFSGTVYYTPYQWMVGAEETGNPMNGANANYVADAFANLGFLGVFLMTLILLVAMLVYNRVALGKSIVLGLLPLFVIAQKLNNVGVHSAIVSGGLAVLILLMALAPDGTGIEVRRCRGNSKSGGRRGVTGWDPRRGAQLGAEDLTREAEQQGS